VVQMGTVVIRRLGSRFRFACSEPEQRDVWAVRCRSELLHQGTMASIIPNTRRGRCYFCWRQVSWVSGPHSPTRYLEG